MSDFSEGEMILTPKQGDFFVQHRNEIFAKRLLFDSINLEYRPLRRRQWLRLETVVLSLLAGLLGGMLSGWLLTLTTG
jgi:hypothetical protein